MLLLLLALGALLLLLLNTLLCGFPALRLLLLPGRLLLLAHFTLLLLSLLEFLAALLRFLLFARLFLFAQRLLLVFTGLELLLTLCLLLIAQGLLFSLALARCFGALLCFLLLARLFLLTQRLLLFLASLQFLLALSLLLLSLVAARGILSLPLLLFLRRFMLAGLLLRALALDRFAAPLRLLLAVRILAGAARADCGALPDLLFEPRFALGVKLRTAIGLLRPDFRDVLRTLLRARFAALDHFLRRRGSAVGELRAERDKAIAFTVSARDWIARTDIGAGDADRLQLLTGRTYDGLNRDAGIHDLVARNVIIIHYACALVDPFMITPIDHQAQIGSEEAVGRHE
jgi:hypothetical protein